MIIRHTAKAVSHGYGGCSCHFYDLAVNNCENLAKSCVLGINESQQGPGIVYPIYSIGLLGPVGGLLNAIRNFDNALETSSSISVPLEARISTQVRKFDELTYNYSSEKERIERYINQAKNNHSYTRSKYLIEQEKFETRIEVYPKD